MDIVGATGRIEERRAVVQGPRVVLAGWLRRPDGFAIPPEARPYGHAARGRDMVAGRFLLGGVRLDAPGTPIWDLRLPASAVHAFGWLDDLVAEGSDAALGLARAWTREWIARFGRRPPEAARAVAGRRVLAWITHGEILLEGASASSRRAFLRSLARQASRLARKGASPGAGIAAVEAGTAVLLAALHLRGRARRIDRAAAALARTAAEVVEPAGTLASRNPEALAEVFALLVAARTALAAAGRPVPPQLSEAVARTAPVLRALRHGDGGLARFHGGGRGVPGRLDHALAASGLRAAAPGDRAMGFVRLSAGRTTLIADAAAPPVGPGSDGAHASTLAFELSSGRRALVVNCGSGAPFGPKWRRAGRATPSHSTLAIDGYSSSRLEPRPDAPDAARIGDAPQDVRVERRRDEHATGFVAGHDGYVATHGLTHVRRIFLDHDGRRVAGEDVLATVEREDEALFDRAMDEIGWDGIPLRLRFHLHPDVAASIEPDGGAVLLGLLNGERWAFRHDGRAALSLEPSVYLDAAALAPLPTLQVVLAASALDYATRLRWTLAKTRETPDAVRDLDHREGAVLA